MRLEENWTVRPDGDSERVMPATHRNMAPRDSAFYKNGRESEADGPEPDAAEQAADGWVVWSIMRAYND